MARTIEASVGPATPINLVIPGDLALENGLEEGFQVDLVTEEELNDYMRNGTYAPDNGGTGVIHLFF